MMRLASIFPAVALAAMILALPARAAQVVVVGGNAPGLAPGQVVDADAALDIPAGATVTLVSESGRSVTLKGPHAGPSGLGGGGAAGQGKGLVSSLSGLLAGTGGETASLGVMRAVGVKKPPDDPWVIDVGQGGHHCAAAGAAALWRANGKKERVFTLKNLNDRSKATARWPAGADELPWPDAVSLTDGGRYVAGFKGSRATRKFTLHVVPGGLPSDAHRAAWMAENGCLAQARRILAGLR